MKVTLIARTAFNSEIAHDLTGWEGTAKDTDGALLTEFAGRACYQSWNKPNKTTATNDGYLDHIVQINHMSVFEHGSATFYVEDVSRTLTHELIRHRHISPSQLSQRYVKMGPDVRPVIPPLYRTEWTDETDPQQTETQGIIESIWTASVAAYNTLVDIWEHRLYAQGVTGTELKKRAREAARCVLPNMTPTAIVISANHRTWRHFLTLRGSLDADVEIRELAMCLYEWLHEIEPAIYSDFMALKVPDGREYLNLVKR